MPYLIAFFVGLGTGVFCLWLYVSQTLRSAKDRVASAEAKVKGAAGREAATFKKEQEIARQQQLLQAKAADLDVARLDQQKRSEEFARQVVSYTELQGENALLKRDLQNIDVNLNKLALDGQFREEQQGFLRTRSDALAERYLKDTVKSVVAAVGPSNFTSCKARLLDVIEKCRLIGFDIPAEQELTLLADLRREFEKEVRLAFEREEQARIKAQIREEERLKREVERELKQLERERMAIQAALDQALAAAEGKHSAEVERLQARLADAEEKAKRAISMAQQTKAGHVYVISNLGSFGDGVFKVGMSRRLVPQERIDELGCAAVPFPFDVHVMIHSTNAPALENALHRALHRCRINRANPRKEFFRADLQEILKIVRENHGEVEHVIDPVALEYRQSLTMTAEDAAYVDAVFEAAEEEAEIIPD